MKKVPTFIRKIFIIIMCFWVAIVQLPANNVFAEDTIDQGSETTETEPGEQENDPGEEGGNEGETEPTVDLNTYTVTFYVDGNAHDSQEVNENELVSRPSDPNKESYVFDGWYDESLSNKYDFNSPVTNNLNLYAKFDEAIAFVEQDGNRTYYKNVSDALAASRQGGSVTLLANINVTELNIPSNIDFVLNGHKLVLDINSKVISGKKLNTSDFEFDSNLTLDETTDGNGNHIYTLLDIKTGLLNKVEQILGFKSDMTVEELTTLHDLALEALETYDTFDANVKASLGVNYDQLLTAKHDITVALIDALIESLPTYDSLFGSDGLDTNSFSFTS